MSWVDRFRTRSQEDMWFGDLLRHELEFDNMTQDDLASYLGVSRQYISKILLGDTYPSPNKLRKICELFKWSYDQIVRCTAVDLEPEVAERFLEKYEPK